MSCKLLLKAWNTSAKLLFLLTSNCLRKYVKNQFGIVLISSVKKCGACGANLNTKADCPRKPVLLTESSGTLPALHYWKVCTQSSCNHVQHYGFHSLGKVTSEYFVCATSACRYFANEWLHVQVKYIIHLCNHIWKRDIFTQNIFWVINNIWELVSPTPKWAMRYVDLCPVH